MGSLSRYSLCKFKITLPMRKPLKTLKFRGILHSSLLNCFLKRTMFYIISNFHFLCSFRISMGSLSVTKNEIFCNLHYIFSINLSRATKVAVYPALFIKNGIQLKFFYKDIFALINFCSNMICFSVITKKIHPL